MIELVLFVFIVITLYLLYDHIKNKENFKLAIPDAQGCDGTFTQDMYHNTLNPFDFGFTYSTGLNPEIYPKNAEPKLVL